MVSNSNAALTGLSLMSFGTGLSTAMIALLAGWEVALLVLGACLAFSGAWLVRHS